MSFDAIDRRHAPPKADTTAIRQAVKEYFDPWLENLHPVHEASLRSIIEQVAGEVDEIIANYGVQT